MFGNQPDRRSGRAHPSDSGERRLHAREARRNLGQRRPTGLVRHPRAMKPFQLPGRPKECRITSSSLHESVVAGGALKSLPSTPAGVFEPAESIAFMDKRYFDGAAERSINGPSMPCLTRQDFLGLSVACRPARVGVSDRGGLRKAIDQSIQKDP